MKFPQIDLGPLFLGRPAFFTLASDSDTSLRGRPGPRFTGAATLAEGALALMAFTGASASDGSKMGEELPDSRAIT